MKSEQALQKASQLLLSYATIVYTEEEINIMKMQQQMHSESIYGTGGTNSSHQTTKQSITSGIGSLFGGMFNKGS
jgi:hypothetical protein